MFGKGCCIPSTKMESATNQGLFAAMVSRKLKFGLGDGGLVQVGLFSGGLGGPKPPTSAPGNSWKVDRKSVV